MNSATATAPVASENPAASDIGPPPPSAAHFDWRSTVRECHTGGTVTEATLRRVVELLVGLPKARAALALWRKGDSPLVPVTSFVCRSAVQDEIPQWQAQIEPNIREMCQQGIALTTAPLNDGIELISVGIGPPHLPHVVLCLFADTFSGAKETILLSLQVVAAEIEAWFGCPAGPTDSELLLKHQLLWDACHAGEDPTGFYQMASQLSSLLDHQFVAMGTLSGKSTCQLRGVSGIPQLVRPSPLADNCETVMAEAIIRGKCRSVSSRASTTQTTEAEQKLFELCGATRVVSGPLGKGEVAPTAAWVVAINEPPETEADPVDWIDRISGYQPLMAAAVDALCNGEPGRFRKLCSTLGGSRGKHRVIVALGILILAGLCLPLPYRVKCPVELQPVRKRFVPAPYDGVLEMVLVEPGDVVSEHQVVARMDGREIEWQLASARAERKKFGKEHDAAMARSDTAAAQVAKLQAEQNNLDIQLLERQLAQLEVKSPIAGTILGGDPRKMEGAHLKTGQTLFEIGPLDAMVVEVRVPDDEVAYVEVGDHVRTRLDAFPHRPLAGQIRRLAPQADLIDQQNVFVAEVGLENPQQLFRPGMKGQAAITTDWRPLGWNLFHRAGDKLRFWVGL